MTKGDILRKLTNNRIYLFGVLSFLTLAIIIGTKTVYAYYYQNTSISNIVTGFVGDFYTGDGDINMNIYIMNNSGGYTKSDTIPVSGYTFNNSKTSCTSVCVQNTTSADCYYVYDSTEHTIALTSNSKVTCSFYFDK